MMKKVMLGIIAFYQKRISPRKKPCCRFYPSCSEYAFQAIDKYGACRGGFLATKRILKCHPFHKGGYDPLK